LLQHAQITDKLTALERLRLAKALSHSGDVTTLKKLWDVDMNIIPGPGDVDLRTHAVALAKFGIRGDKFNVICFLRTKGLLNNADPFPGPFSAKYPAVLTYGFYLLFKAAKYGRLQILNILCDEMATYLHTRVH